VAAGGLTNVSTAAVVAAGGLTNVTAAQVVAAGGLTNVSGAAIVAAGGLTNVSTAAVVAAGGLTNVTAAQVVEAGGLTNGQHNVALGTNVTLSGQSIVMLETTNDNVGMESITYPVTGQTNSTWMGYGTLDSSPGYWNAAFGQFASKDAAGNENSTFGYQAGYMSPGSFNGAFGAFALLQSAGNDNNAFGNYALAFAPGKWNTAVGSTALNLSPGYCNSSVGFESLAIAPGSSNVAVGAYSLELAPGNRNSAIGAYAGYLSPGERNLFLGCEAGKSASTTYYTNAIAIGAGAVPIGNNSAVIGNAQTVTTEIKGNVVISNNLSVVGAITSGGNTVLTNVTAAQVVAAGALTNVTQAMIGAAGGLTNNGCTVNGQFLANGSDLTIAGTGSVSAVDCTNIVQGVLAVAISPTYYVTNTIVVTNSQDFAIPIAGNNVRVRWLAMFLSATNEAAVSKRASFAMFTRPDRLCDSVIYSDTNQLYWTAPSTSAQDAGASTGTVADASGVVLYDRYAVGNGETWDMLTITNATATTLFYACTNKYATTAASKISHANYLTPVFYDDDSGTSNAWCRFAWTTGHTGTVTTIMRYSK
jgi:hypothetical protein